jgi:hypothetical protein
MLKIAKVSQMLPESVGDALPLIALCHLLRHPASFCHLIVHACRMACHCALRLTTNISVPKGF